MKHNISKVIILSCLFFGTIANAQNFYICVPKDDWFNKRFDTRMLYEKFESAKKQIDNDKVWEIVADNQKSGMLERGVYRVLVAGGGGGHGGGAGPSSCKWTSAGGSGGNGHVEKEVILLFKKYDFTAVIGNRGYNGGHGGRVRHGSSRGGRGGSGTPSELDIIGFKNYFAGAGTGGGGGWAHSCSAANGGNGSSYGNGQNGGGGYVKIYKYIG